MNASSRVRVASAVSALGLFALAGCSAGAAAPQASSAAPATSAASSTTAATPAVASPAATSAEPSPAASSAEPSTPAPAPTTSAAPTASTPAAPVASTPAAPVASTPAAPVASTPAAPAQPATPTPAATPTVTGLADLSLEDRQKWAYSEYSIFRGPHQGKTVMLTYDDCPTSYDAFEEAVLGAEKLGIRLALFPTGECLTWGKFSPKFAREHGAYVFNHGNHHYQTSELSGEQAAEEITAAIRSSWARPPYGEFTDTVKNRFADQGMRIWLWDIDTEDWNGHKSQSTIVDYVSDNAYAGSTVLMHMQENAFNVSAMSQIKKRLAAEGLKLCANTGPAEQFPRTISCS